MKRWQWRTLGLAIGALLGVAAVVIVRNTIPSAQQHQVSRSIAAHPACSQVTAVVENDYYFDDKTSVSRIVGAAQCLIGRQFPTIVVMDRQNCSIDDVTEVIDATQTQKGLTYCDEGLVMTLAFVNRYKEEPTALQWFSIASAAVNSRYRTFPSIFCATGYVITQIPEFEKDRAVHLSYLSREITTQVLHWMLAGVALYEQHQPINACDQRGSTATTVRFGAGGNTPPAPAVTLLPRYAPTPPLSLFRQSPPPTAAGWLF